MGRFGAHIGGGLATAPQRAEELGAECAQVFASAPQNWRPPNHADAVVDQFRQGMSDRGLGPAVLHAIYLLNPASLDEALVERTVSSIATHLHWAGRLDALGLIIHLGSSGKQPVDEALGRVAANLRAALERNDGPARLILETCAGQGNTIGRSFEEIGELLRQINDPRTGVCLDTCHIFAAGYDFTTAEGLAQLVAAFDREIGREKLLAVHVNDSKGAAGSNIDRHENIGLGHIGEEAFARFLTHEFVQNVPLYLEVPGVAGDGPDKENLAALRRLAGVTQ